MMAHRPGDLQVVGRGACAPSCEARGLVCKRSLHLNPKQEKINEQSLQHEDSGLDAAGGCAVGWRLRGRRARHRTILKVMTELDHAEKEGLHSGFIPMVRRDAWS